MYRACVVRVTQFFLLFFTRALLGGIRGILFKLEMFSKRITICGGVRRRAARLTLTDGNKGSCCFCVLCLTWLKNLFYKYLCQVGFVTEVKGD